jgi:hypothetical protein
MGGLMGKMGDAAKTFGNEDSPMWQQAVGGGLSGAAKGMQNIQRPQSGPMAQFEVSSPQLQPEQPSNYLDEAKRRMGAFYGGRM